MTSDAAPATAFVWAYLPGDTVPVVVGRVDRRADRLLFGYAASYLRRPDAISLYEPELPLAAGTIEPLPGLSAPGCILDAAPDAWGRRVILNRMYGPGAADELASADLDDLLFLLGAGSDRIGALDFQASPETYVARSTGRATLEDLLNATQLIESGMPVPGELAEALNAGSSAGGARPKAILRDGDGSYLAKFSSLDDTYPVVRGEHLAMHLAGLCGLDVADVQLERVQGKDVLLVRRFDRNPAGERRMLVSGLTILGLPATAFGYASYGGLADAVRERFTDPRPTLRELFGRASFNIISGNTDDHARNHAAFWDGTMLQLTPAYDISVMLRSGGEATQAMRLGREDDPYRFSRLAGLIERAPVYGLTSAEGREIVNAQLHAVRLHWSDACDRSGLTELQRSLFKSVFPSNYALEGL